MICLCVAGLAFHLSDGYLIYFSLHSAPVFLIVLGVLNFSIMILPVKKEISVLSSGTVHTTERLLVHFTHMDLPPQFARNICNILKINRNESVFWTCLEISSHIILNIYHLIFYKVTARSYNKPSIVKTVYPVGGNYHHIPCENGRFGRQLADPIEVG